MEKNRLVNEDSIDLRREIYNKQLLRNRSPHRTTSQQVISPSQISSEQKDRKPLRVNGLKKLANNLCYGDQANLLQKNRSYFRNKQRSRATSADPRFRRERSPVFSKEASQTQSDSQVMDPSIQNMKKKNKTQSDSKFILDHPVGIKKTMIPKPIGPYPTDQSEPIDCASTDLHEKYSPRSENYSRKSTIGKTDSVKFSNISNLYSCETLTASNMEQSTMTEEIKGAPTSIDCRSMYQTAVTDSDTVKSNVETGLYNASEIYLDSEALKSYWDDPRLIEKYSKLLKPVHIRKSKSSLTLPLTETTNCITTTTKPKPICSKCICTKFSKPVDSGYETYQGINDSVINYKSIRNRVYKAMRSNYYLAAFFMIGSLCGLMLVTLVVWVLANDIIWSYMSRQEPPKLRGFKWLTAYVGGAFLHSINVIFNAFYYMIVMPRNEVFELLKAEENT